jgi:hypothetical protein
MGQISLFSQKLQVGCQPLEALGEKYRTQRTISYEKHYSFNLIFLDTFNINLGVTKIGEAQQKWPVKKVHLVNLPELTQFIETRRGLR